MENFSYEEKVGKEIYVANQTPSDEVAAQQFNNRSVEEKLDINGGLDTGEYAISDSIREIVAVHMEDGNLAAFKLDNGEILSKAEAIELTKQGGIKDVNVGRRGSRETLRRNPVEDASKSLTNMPRF